MKSFIAISVEDEAVELVYGKVEFDGENSVVAKGFDRAVRYPNPVIDKGNPVSDYQDFFPDGLRKMIFSYIGTCLKDSLPIDAVGLSVFGNIDPKGVILNMPISGKSDNSHRVFQIGKELRDEFKELKKIPIVLSNDASAAAMGEVVDGNGRTHEHAFAYVWLGRGVNAGIVLNGSVHGGFLHPEIAHYLPRIDSRDYQYVHHTHHETDPCCLVHRDCLLGLMSMRALEKRKMLGMNDDLIASIYAHYLASLCCALTVTVAPARIVADGYIFRSGYLNRDAVLGEARRVFKKMIGSFPTYPQITNADRYIIPGGLVSKPALHGIIELVIRALRPEVAADLSPPVINASNA